MKECSEEQKKQTKNMTESINYKDTIITQLTEIMNERKKTNDVWKVRAYKKVIDVLNNVNTPITKMEDINELPGIGKSIKEKIQEIFDNNIITEIKNMSPEEKLKTEVIEKLTKVSTIGIKKAEDLYNKHNIRSIEDLKNKQDLLNDKQKIGLFYYEDEQIRIKYKEMQKHSKLILETISDFDNEIICNIAGSYRRESKDSGDIDILITKSNETVNGEELFKSVVDMLISKKYIKDTLAYGKKKFMGYCRLPKHKTHRRIDILYSDPNKYAFALLYFTGDYSFNISMRNIAQTKGYSLNEYGLIYTSGDKKGEYVNENFLNEKDIFDFLEIDFVEPKNRNKEVLNKYLL
jgi:DNA polymerase/3'-5' exonuclease PolX